MSETIRAFYTFDQLAELVGRAIVAERCPEFQGQIDSEIMLNTHIQPDGQVAIQGARAEVTLHPKTPCPSPKQPS